MTTKIVDFYVVGMDKEGAKKELHRILRDHAILSLEGTHKLKDTTIGRAYHYRVSFGPDVSEFIEEEE